MLNWWCESNLWNAISNFFAFERREPQNVVLNPESFKLLHDDFLDGVVINQFELFNLLLALRDILLSLLNEEFVQSGDRFVTV